ncbi:MAG: hypothetical protein JNM70_09135 [Anaerolineae bacterium]|nr:hypothetical protein [Anaerolineae bacterium]
MTNVLVAYATVHGSTTDMAKKIGEVLEAHGMDVTVEAVQNITGLAGYDALVAGTAIHSGTWLPEMKTFLEHAQSALADKPVYFWVSCIRVLERFGLEHVMDNYMEPQVLATLNVRDKAALAGKLDLQSVDWNERWTLAARYDGETWPSSFDGDFRDWEKVKAWAEKVAQDLKGAKKS